ncbi:MAG: tryptophan 7-halogenase [Bdellovibrionales bacterium]|nr:tryptophan 7-halogenase [Bdellovibrionales bacterium]
MNRRTHALVIGSGAAGCLAARVLSDSFAQVTIVERDPAPSDERTLRKGIPQAAHVHNVLLQGNRQLEHFFPNLFGKEFDRAASPLIEVSQDQRMYGPFGWNPVYPTGWHFRGYSRHLLDRTLSAQTAALQNVRILYSHEVSELVADNGRVTGVRTKQGEVLNADLVVETSGRSSRLETWLSAIGVSEIPTRRVPTTDGYATRTFRWRGAPLPYKQFAILRKPPERPRGAYLLEIEGGRWIVTLVGAQGDFPPHDEAGFLAFAQSLATADVADFITQAEPEGGIHLYRKMENVCRFADRVPNWPAGLIVLGDAVCTFNPVYGQGITTATVSAEYLQRLLKTNREGWERQFHRGLVQILAGPWLLSVREDLIIFAGTSALYKSWAALRHRFRVTLLRHLQQAAPKDRAIHLRLYQVQNLMRPLSSLYSPMLFARALWAKFRLPPPAPLASRLNTVPSGSKKAA